MPDAKPSTSPVAAKISSSNPTVADHSIADPSDENHSDIQQSAPDHRSVDLATTDSAATDANLADHTLINPDLTESTPINSALTNPTGTERIRTYLHQHFNSRQVIIFGLGREGLSTYHFLRAFLPEKKLWLLDEQALSQLSAELQSIVKQDQDVHFRQIDQGLSESLDDISQIVVFKTPGAKTELPFIQKLIDGGAMLSSNTSLCFELISQLTHQPVTIGVTGTKGKSTTASLIHHVLQFNSRPVWLAGNIGTPPLRVLLEVLQAQGLHTGSSDQQPPKQSDQSHQQPIIVFELSSHQLRELKFSPHIAVIQNITPEHLDYYRDFETYQKAKSAIAAYQNNQDMVIYTPEFAGAATIAQLSKGKHLTFAISSARSSIPPKRSHPEQPIASANQDAILYQNEVIVNRADVPLIGTHNLLNVMPAVIIGRELGLTNQQISAAIKSFQPLPHRLEKVAEKNGVLYINDSQATTPEATLAALSSFDGKNIHLIAGGSDKGVDLQPVVEAVLQHQVKTLLLFPPTGEKIAELLAATIQERQTNLEVDLPSPTVIHVKSMVEAIGQAAAAVKNNDVVLLSPACASFGIFKDYQDRGNQFKQAVQEL